MYFVINLLMLKCGSFCVPYTLTPTINRVNDRFVRPCMRQVVHLLNPM